MSSAQTTGKGDASGEGEAAVGGEVASLRQGVEVSHTPPPWRMFRIEDGWNVEGEGYYSIAHVIDKNGWSVNDANARLIAAAPELLEALREVERHHAEQNRARGRDEARSHTLSTVRSAIRKATQP